MSGKRIEGGFAGRAKRRGSICWSSTESCSEIERTNEIDCARNVIGQDAESGFGFDLGYASGEEPSACGHSFDGSEWVLAAHRRWRMRSGSASSRAFIRWSPSW